MPIKRLAATRKIGAGEGGETRREYDESGVVDYKGGPWLVDGVPGDKLGDSRRGNALESTPW
jgi:hypothetical protein